MRQALICSLVLIIAVALAGCACESPLVGAPSAGPCQPPPAAPAAAAPEGQCGPLPAEALPGEVWCCTLIQPPAAAPQRVCVQPESTKEVEIPAVYETYTEQNLVSPERTEWQRVECSAADSASGKSECWSLVTVPAVYETVTKQRLVTPASVRYERVPACYADVAGAAPASVWRWQRYKECEVAPAARPIAPK